MRLATALAIRGPLADVVEQAGVVDALGYEGIWVPEIAGRDALVTCAVIAAATESVTLTTGVVPLPARSPVTLAMGAASLAESTGGRFVLGVGAGHRETARSWLGREPLDVAGVAEHLEVVNEVLANGEVRRPAGVSLPALDFRLRGVHAPAPPPVLLAALGPRMAGLAGEAASGAILNWVTADHARTIAGWVREGAERAGKDPGAVEIACYIPACVGDEADARGELTRQLRAYGSLRAYQQVLAACGITELPEGEIPPNVLDALGAHGDAATVRSRLDEYVDAGVTLPVLAPYPVGDDPWASMVETWSALAPGA